MEVKRQTHLSLAHSYWEKTIQSGDWAIDATCGNGHDTLKLSQICEGVISLDIQEKALEITKERLDQSANVHLFLQSHAELPPLATQVPVRLIVYNLGYLPGGNKKLTTRVSSTLQSLQWAQEILLPGGMISITCYPGHPEGQLEEKALIEMAAKLSPFAWDVCHHQWLNRNLAPSLLLLEKK